jgi:Ni/Co efflux regulator RcnB
MKENSGHTPNRALGQMRHRFFRNSELLSQSGTQDTGARFLQIAIWSVAMKKLVLAIAVAGTALLGGSAANAADNNNTVKASAANDVATQPTDVSARKKHHSRRHYRTGRHWSYRHYRPYYRSYGYAPRPYYGDPYGYRYGYGGPGVTFSFGTGGYRGW